MPQSDYKSQIKRARQLVNHGDLTEAEILLSSLEKSLREEPIGKEIVVDILNEQGKIKYRQGNFETAKQLLEDALSKAREPEPYEYGVAYALHYLGVIAWGLGESDHALEMYEQALNLRRKIEDYRGATASLHNIALYQNQRGNIREALARFNEVLELKKQFGDKPGTVRTLSNMGEIYRRMGDLSGAIPYLREAQELAQKINMKQGKALVDYNMGVIAWARGDIDEAKQRLLDCLGYWQAQKMRDISVAVALRDLAEMMAELGDFDEADGHLVKLDDMSRKSGSNVISCYSSYSHGAVARAKGNAAVALKAFEHCLILAREHKLFELELKSLIQLAEMHLFEFRLTMDDKYLGKTQNYIKDVKKASRERNHPYVWVESSIVNSMLMAAAMDFHAAEAELTQAILSAQEENLPLQERKAEEQLVKVKKLHARADRMIKPPDLDEQVEEIKSYLNKYANALKAFKT
ncbi:MAG: tetratricopeptide repeat protein [Candidatus Hodarchaeota archaeon]